MTKSIALTVVTMLALAVSQPAAASCDQARSFTTLENEFEYSYLYTPGHPFAVGPDGTPSTISSNFDGLFWSFGGGDARIGIGNDMGEFGPFIPTSSVGTAGPYNAWIYPGYFSDTYHYPALIHNPLGFNNWADARVDGCIDYDGTDEILFDQDQCMVVVLTDRVDSVGYFATIAQGPHEGGSYFLNRAAGNSPITLAPIPKPQITGTVHGGDRVYVSLSVPAPTSGMFANCPVAAHNATLLEGFSIHMAVVDHGVSPEGLDFPAGLTVTPGGGVDLEVIDGCGLAPKDIYFAACPIFGGASGVPFESTTCSEWSTIVQCGPTLGDPIEVGPRPRWIGRDQSHRRPGGQSIGPERRR